MLSQDVIPGFGVKRDIDFGSLRDVMMNALNAVYDRMIPSVKPYVVKGASIGDTQWAAAPDNDRTNENPVTYIGGAAIDSYVFTLHLYPWNKGPLTANIDPAVYTEKDLSVDLCKCPSDYIWNARHYGTFAYMLANKSLLCTEGAVAPLPRDNMGFRSMFWIQLS